MKVSDSIINRISDPNLRFMFMNEDFFLQVIDSYKNSYDRTPSGLMFYPVIRDEKVKSLVAYNSHGYYYVLCDNIDLNVVSSFLTKHREQIFSLYTKTTQFLALSKSLRFRFRKTVFFQYMKLLRENFQYREYLYDNYFCRKCDPADFDAIKDIQKGYHLEEVYTDDYYPYEYEMSFFKNSLKKRVNYAVFDKKSLIGVSKGSVNGESIHNYQLGGVYTMPDKRNMGLSSYCLYEMLRNLFMKKQAVSLYVNINNHPAIALYKKLNFENIFNINISYLN